MVSDAISGTSMFDSKLSGRILGLDLLKVFFLSENSMFKADYLKDDRGSRLVV